MDSKASVCVYKINGEELKQRIKDLMKDCVNNFRSFIPRIQFDRFQEIFHGLSRDNAKISKRPRKIDDYVALMNNLREITERMDVYSS